MVDILRRADPEGLNPEDYDGPGWVERFAQLESSDSPEGEVRFDVALTVCAMRYISDLRIGRINPKHFQFGLDVEHKKLNLPSFLRKLISEQLASKHGWPASSLRSRNTRRLAKHC